MLSRYLPLYLVLPAAAGLPTIVCGMYCLLVWAPRVEEFTWYNLDVSLVCWTFCSTGIPALGYLAVATGMFSILGGLTVRRYSAGRFILVLTGILLFPIGLLNFLVQKKY